MVTQGQVWLSGRGLLAPVQVQLEVDGADFVASQPDTGIFGVGPDVAAAIEDLRTALRQHRRVLQVNEGRLAPPLQRQLDYIRQHVSVQ